MCTNTGFSSKTFNPASRILGNKYEVLDPVLYRAEQAEQKAFALPGLPEPAPLQQAAQDPNTTMLRKKRKYASADSGGTLLTGAATALSSGAPTLLGG